MQSHFKARPVAGDRNSSVPTKERDGSACVSSQRVSLAADSHGKPRRPGILKSGGDRASGIGSNGDREHARDGDRHPSIARTRALSQLLGRETDQPQPQSQSHNHIQPRRSRLLCRIGTGCASSTDTLTSPAGKPPAETLSLSVCSLGPGDMFGDDSLRDRITYTYTVKATQRAEVGGYQFSDIMAT
jgi:hypothetical protein